MPTLQSPFGTVTLPEPTISSLRENAGDWLCLAELHFSEGQALAEDGDIDTALEQLGFCVTKIDAARARLMDARELRNNTRDS